MGLLFKGSYTIATFPFQIAHSDVWTSPINRNYGFNYYVLFLDQYSHFLWVYLLKAKSDVYSKFVNL